LTSDNQPPSDRDVLDDGNDEVSDGRFDGRHALADEFYCDPVTPPLLKHYRITDSSNPVAPTLGNRSPSPTVGEGLFLVWHQRVALDSQQGQPGPTSQPSSARRRDDCLQLIE
jgi:hypothetical protein